MLFILIIWVEPLYGYEDPLNVNISFKRGSSKLKDSGTKKIDSFIKSYQSIAKKIKEQEDSKELEKMIFVMYPITSKSEYQKFPCIGLKRYHTIVAKIKKKYSINVEFAYKDSEFDKGEHVRPKINLYLKGVFTDYPPSYKTIEDDRGILEYNLTFKDSGSNVIIENKQNFSRFLERVYKAFMDLNKTRPIETSTRIFKIYVSKEWRQQSGNQCELLKRFRKFKSFVKKSDKIGLNPEYHDVHLKKSEELPKNGGFKLIVKYKE